MLTAVLRKSTESSCVLRGRHRTGFPHFQNPAERDSSMPHFFLLPKILGDQFVYCLFSNCELHEDRSLNDTWHVTAPR